MSYLKLLTQLKTEELLEKTFKAGILPNDGGIIAGFPETIISFNEEEFYLFIFEGIFRPKYDYKHQFKFSEIRGIEMGKYHFKNHYLKLIFEDDRYFVFNYFYRVKGAPKQSENVKAFIDKLTALATIVEKETEG